MPVWLCPLIKNKVDGVELKFNEFFFLANQRLEVIKKKIVEQHGRVHNI